MDISFEPQRVRIIIELTPQEAREVMIDFPPVVYDLNRPLAKIAKAILAVTKMSSEEVLREMKIENEIANSGPGGWTLRSERPGQRGDSRP